MRKILSYRNIASFLFIATFLIFVLAQRYTTENLQMPTGDVSGVDQLLNKEKRSFTENDAKDTAAEMNTIR